jgi:hypothetical protein
MPYSQETYDLSGNSLEQFLRRSHRNDVVSWGLAACHAVHRQQPGGSFHWEHSVWPGLDPKVRCSGFSLYKKIEFTARFLRRVICGTNLRKIAAIFERRRLRA